MLVLGTAGHVDHGKSLLVKALTGIDPDRLPEEKERGMTLDLGFAWLKLPGGREVGIVDVPGHERFIKNMLAGVGGIDLALLVVAANEGVMAQTREHLAIIDLLGIGKGIVVITKKDLVDEELLSLVMLEIEELIQPTVLREAPVVSTSAVTGEGMAELVSTIDRTAATIPPRKDGGRPRLPIDRIFTVAGSGTIVTGTLIGGSLSRGQEVEIVPSGIKSRLRGLQTHKARIETARPGSRVAANLVGVSTSELKRGDVLTTPRWLEATTMIDVRLRLLPHLQRPLAHNASVTLHTGTAEVIATLHMLEKEKLGPGETGWAQLILTAPVAVIMGDRFIIRSPQETLGGGEIVDPHPRRHRGRRPAVIEGLKARGGGEVREVLIAVLETIQPAATAALAARCDLPAHDVQVAVEELIRLGTVVGVGQQENLLLFTRSGWNRLVEKTKSVLQDYHGRFPTRQGMPRAELEGKLKLPQPASAGALKKLSEEGILVEERGTIRLPTHHISLTQAQQAAIDAFLSSLARNPYSPASDLTPEPDLLSLLVKQRQVVKVSDDVIFTASAYDEMVCKITDHIKQREKITLAEVRDLFGTSRKYAQALLEYLDEKKVTRRVGDERVLR